VSIAANPSWDPAVYLAFGDERLRPALDLVARIPHRAPRRVVDLGCGTGSALPALAARFPGAELLGVDGSPEMLAKVPGGVATACADIAAWAPAPEARPDVIFSNAALQWLPDHAALFPRLLGLLAPGGCLAVQMPAMHAAPLRALQPVVAATGPWAARLSGIASAPDILEPGGYYELLAPCAAALELWVTEYVHVLRREPGGGRHPAVRWAMGTSLRPYTDALAEDPALRKAFLAAYEDALAPHYPPQSDGAVLLPFRRQFILAKAVD
jgi:trans-aconitate 2-methyltransferase